MLPHRPALRPGSALLWRTDTELTVGNSPDEVVIDGATPQWLTWVRGLDGSRTVDEVLAAAPSPEHAATLLRALSAGRVLDDAAIAPRTARSGGRKMRDMLAAARPVALLLHGTAPHALVALERRSQARVCVLGDEQLSLATIEHLRTAGIEAAVGEPGDDTDLVLWCAPADLDAWDAQPWMVTTAHLGVCANGRRLSIGPLVVPGRTPCWECARLQRIDQDPAWPRLATQLIHRPPTLHDPAATAVAASWVSALTRSVIDAGVSSTRQQQPLPQLAVLGQRIEMELPSGEIHATQLAAHPHCSCQWSETA